MDHQGSQPAGVRLKEDDLIIPADLLTEMIGDIQDYASSTTFKDREIKWRDTLLKRARAVLAAKEPQP